MLDVIGFGALSVDLIYQVPQEIAARLPYKPGEESLPTPSLPTPGVGQVDTSGILALLQRREKFGEI